MTIAKQKQHDVVRQAAMTASQEWIKEMDMSFIRKLIEDMEVAAKEKGWIVVWDVVEVV